MVLSGAKAPEMCGRTASGRARDRQNGNDRIRKAVTLDHTVMRPVKSVSAANYEGLVADLSRLLEDARRVSARAVNTVMTAIYWEFGRRIVEFEQGGEKRAGYGE